MNKLITIIILIATVVSCKKDGPDTVPNIEVNSEGGKVLIGCEGNFQFGNASLAHYSYTDSVSALSVFETINSRSLGDVLQSMTIHNHQLYLVLNNSGVIEVVNPIDFSWITTIKGFTSPRYFLPISNAKAYVSDLYSNSIQVVDLNSNTVQKTIKVNGWTEEMVLLYGKAFVCNTAQSQVYVIDVETDTLIDSVQVGAAPNSVVEDKNGMLWVLCGGDINDNKSVSSLVQFNPSSLLITVNKKFEEGSRASQLRINGQKDELFFLYDGVQKINLTTPDVIIEQMVEKQNSNLYGLGIDPVDGNVFVADAKDYIQGSTVRIYDRNGSFLRNFQVGINASSFIFDR